MTFSDQVLALSGLEYYWRLGDVSTSVAADAGPHSAPGAYVGGVTQNQPSAIPSEPADPSIVLGGGGDYVTLPSIAVDFTGGFTFLFWAKPTSNANHARFIDLDAGGGGNLGMMMYRSATGDAITLDVFNSGGDHAVLTSGGGAIINDEWHLYIGTVDATGYAAIYRDLELIADRTGMSLPDAGTRVSNFLGRSNFYPADDDYQGGLDDVAILSLALTIEQITEIVNAGTATAPNLPDLHVQACWNPAYAANWGGPTGIWTQPYATLDDYECIFEAKVMARAGNPDLEDDSFTFTLTNSDGLYDPWNPDSPVQPYLGVGRLLRALTVQSGVTRCVHYGTITTYHVDAEPQEGRGYQITITSDSPLKTLLAVEIDLPTFNSPVPYDASNPTERSWLPLIFRNRTDIVTNFMTDLTDIRDSGGTPLPGGTDTIGGWLSKMAEATGGTYFCRPKYRTTLSGQDYEIVWLTAAYLRTGSLGFTVLDTAGDIESPAQAVYGVQGLAA